ncbi:MAG TPA: hypothetical protein PLY88_09155 [Candidatus Omnitrophota bacterium]|nr:hypothetical protein [Candidatus Omnitrophota bacterium]HRK62694.1 hypothetical protein [Candidatus Omnitrophota bacterium]
MINVIRVTVVILGAIFGYLSDLKWLVDHLGIPDAQWMGAVIGLCCGTIVVLLDLFFKQYSVRNVLSVIIGLALGLLTHHLFIQALTNMQVDMDLARQLGLVSSVILPYLGIITILRGQEEFTLMLPFIKLDAKGSGEDLVLLDTSVVIDGRIADMVKTNFLACRLVVPTFVLKELQLISDSSDSLKRARGRRGLDILNRMKANTNVEITINEMDFSEIPTVDSKLVKMGKVLNARIFTNDYNLNKVAELQGVKVLNINDLANALKPVVMPGELMQVRLLKEGKEPDQAVAYLDDGTMVVVDNGRRHLGQTMNVAITSVLQTQAGRMIFAKADENASYEARERATEERNYERQQQRDSGRSQDYRRNNNRPANGGNEGYPKR